MNQRLIKFNSINFFNTTILALFTQQQLESRDRTQTSHPNDWISKYHGKPTEAKDDSLRNYFLASKNVAFRDNLLL